MPVAMSIPWKPLRDSHYVIASLQREGGGLRQLVARQSILHDVQAIARENPDWTIVGLLLGERFDCSVTLAPYVVIESHVEVALPSLDERSVVDAIQTLRGQIGRRNSTDVVGWFCSNGSADARVSPIHAAIHAASFAERWQTVLIIGNGANAGAFFLHDQSAARWFHAPFFELVDLDAARRPPKPTCVAWPAYLTTAATVPLTEAPTTEPVTPRRPPTPEPTRQRSTTFARPIVTTRRTPTREAIIEAGRAAGRSVLDFAKSLGVRAIAALRRAIDKVVRIRAERAESAARQKAEAEAARAREDERRAKEAAERRAAREAAQRRAAELAKQRAAEMEARRAAEAEVRRKEMEARRAAEEEARRKEAEEAEKRRAAEAEEAERRRIAEAEVAERRRAAQAEARRKEEEEAAKRRAAEAEARRKAAEEAERRRVAEAEARRQSAEAEAQRRAEAEARRQAEEAEARRVAELDAQRKAAEETKRRAAETEARRKAAEEAEARRKVEEEERHKAEEEKWRRAAEAEEEKRRRAAEAEARRQAEEAEVKRQADEQEARRRAEAEAEAKRQAAEAEARRLADEEARRIAAEAEVRRRTEEAKAAAQRQAEEAEAERRRQAIEAEAEARRKEVEAAAERRRKAEEAEALRISVEVAAIRQKLARAPVEGPKRQAPNGQSPHLADLEDTKATDGPYRYLALARREGFEVSEKIERGTLDRPETVWLLHDAASGLRLFVVASDEEVREATLHYNMRTEDDSVLQATAPDHRDLKARVIYGREACLNGLRAKCRRLRATGALERDWKVSPT
jgi:hypothetical protein